MGFWNKRIYWARKDQQGPSATNSKARQQLGKCPCDVQHQSISWGMGKECMLFILNYVGWRSEGWESMNEEVWDGSPQAEADVAPWIGQGCKQDATRGPDEICVKVLPYTWEWEMIFCPFQPVVCYFLISPFLLPFILQLFSIIFRTYQVVFPPLIKPHPVHWMSAR